MKKPAFALFTPGRLVLVLPIASSLLFVGPAFAVSETGLTNTYNGSLAASGLSANGNWTPYGSPFSSSGSGAYADLVFTGAATGSAFTTTGGSNTFMNAESYNVTDGNSYTLQINSSTSAAFRVGTTSNTGTSEVILPFTNSVSNVPQDLIYLTNGSSLTFNATNAGGGTAAQLQVRQAGNFNVGTGSVLTINSPITGSAAISITGGGSTILNGTNTHSGTFNLNNGSVLISGSRAGGGTNIRNGTLEITGTNGGTNYTLQNTVDNPAGTAPQLKLGNLTALPASAQIIGSTSGARSGSVNLAVAGSYTLDSYQRGTIAFNNSSGSPVTLTFTAASAISGGADGGRTFTNSSADLGIVFASTLDIGSSTDGNVTINTNGTITVTGDLLSTGTGIRNLAKGSAGSLILNGASTHTGTTTLSGGLLRLGHANALPGGIGATGGTSNLVFGGTTGLLGLTAASGDFLRTVGTGTDQFVANPTADSAVNRSLGFAAFGGDRIVDVGAQISLSSTSLAGRGLVLSHATADSKVTIENAIALNGAARTILVNDGTAEVDGELSGAISSATATLVKTGTGTLALTGTNSYGSTSGGTDVQAGVLRVNGTSLSDTSKLTLSGGVVHVTGTEAVGSLFFGTEEQATGTWGATGSGATNIDNTRFAGPGVIQVGALPAGGFDSWKTANSTNGGITDDHDNDGVTNGVEYFIGGPTGVTSGFTPQPALDAETMSITWAKGSGYTGTYGTHFWVETSETLAEPWTKETIPGGSITDESGFVKFTFPNPLATKKFARLVVTGP